MFTQTAPEVLLLRGGTPQMPPSRQLGSCHVHVWLLTPTVHTGQHVRACERASGADVELWRKWRPCVCVAPDQLLQVSHLEFRLQLRALRRRLHEHVRMHVRRRGGVRVGGLDIQAFVDESGVQRRDLADLRDDLGLSGVELQQRISFVVGGRARDTLRAMRQ